MKEEVIEVDKKDNKIRGIEKMTAHRNAVLHRAFSIYIFNEKNSLLLQKRASGKYHSGGLWSNTCCGHPRPNEDLESSAHRRLREEMGFDCELKEISTFIYKAKLNNELTEHEFLHVFIGNCDPKVNPDENEAESWKWINMNTLKKEVLKNPENFTFWFKITLDKLKNLFYSK